MDGWHVMQAAIELCTGETVADLPQGSFEAALAFTLDYSMSWLAFLNAFGRGDPDKIAAGECVLELLAVPMIGV